MAVRGGDAFDKSLSLDSDWATDFAATTAFIRQNKLWAGGAIYNNTSDQALPLSLARTHGSTDLDTLWQGFAGDARLRGDAIRQWLDRDLGRRLSVSFMANQVPWFDNLYVTDGACMPTSGGANPTLTIQANAFRVADHLLTFL